MVTQKRRQSVADPELYQKIRQPLDFFDAVPVSSYCGNEATITGGTEMKDYDTEIAQIIKRLKQKRAEKRKAEAKEQAKEQQKLDRRHLLLGRTIAQTFNSKQFEKLRGHVGNRKSDLGSLSERDYQNLMAFFDEQIRPPS
jgi:hypothetical protein